eukprot:COSAG06_NODE_66163_length_255_cov_0.647436_1_plen_53_part_00
MKKLMKALKTKFGEVGVQRRAHLRARKELSASRAVRTLVRECEPRSHGSQIR